ncbi:hypothetical protein PR048_018256 [Dryococelus australis]|uniref:Mutator-like transposase domain-containing protein n=1 Tax=Dryococelus australis TaxID=614101 RepID=A0ABQ9HC03_9NEOP|nr:hypothetical protein PR048_018256 [Dryococelus australis]
MLATPQKLTTTLSLTEKDDVAVVSSDSDQKSKLVTRDCAQLLEAVENLSSSESLTEKFTHQEMTNPGSSNIKIEDRRLFDVAFLFQEMSRISQHNKVFHCSFVNMQLIKEHRKGMISSYYFQCNMCGTIKIISSEDPRKNFNSNMAWVNSMVLTGQSFTQLQEITSTMEVPCMANETFNKCQIALSSVIHDVAWQRMKAASKEGASLALEKGNVVFDGVILIAVFTDEAWCKQSYEN